MKIFFHSPGAIKAQKLTAVGLFKVESVLSKSLKIANFSAEIRNF